MYKEKYLKYKEKYLKLKDFLQIGGIRLRIGPENATFNLYVKSANLGESLTAMKTQLQDNTIEAVILELRRYETSLLKYLDKYKNAVDKKNKMMKRKLEETENLDTKRRRVEVTSPKKEEVDVLVSNKGNDLVLNKDDDFEKQLKKIDKYTRKINHYKSQIRKLLDKLNEKFPENIKFYWEHVEHWAKGSQWL